MPELIGNPFDSIIFQFISNLFVFLHRASSAYQGWYIIAHSVPEEAYPPSGPPSLTGMRLFIEN